MLPFEGDSQRRKPGLIHVVTMYESGKNQALSVLPEERLVQYDRYNWKTTSADSMAVLPKNVSQLRPPPSCYTHPCATLCIPQTVLDSRYFSLFC